jgi:hypothetical protein
MKNFEMTSSMLTMTGVFYPKGYAFIMLPNATDARHVAQEITSQQDDEKQVLFLSSHTILQDVGKVKGESDIALPSLGTEGVTADRYVDLAREGHCALMVKVDTDQETERVMQVARHASFSYGQRYRLFVIEDLE